MTTKIQIVTVDKSNNRPMFVEEIQGTDQRQPADRRKRPEPVINASSRRAALRDA